MAKLFFDRIFYRAAATPITTATKGGTYPAYTIANWTPLVGGIAEKAKLGISDDGKDVMGDGTEYAGGEKIPVEINIKNFTAANYGTIRAAFLNTRVDLIFMDTEQPGTSYAAHGVVLYPKLEMSGGEEPMINLTGERKLTAGLALFTPVTVS